MKTVEVIQSMDTDCDAMNAFVYEGDYMHTTATTARESAATLSMDVSTMNAKINAFNSIIKQLNRSCIISTQAFNAADIRLNTKWSETLRIIDLPEPMSQTESHWDKWAKRRVEETKAITSSNVMVDSSIDEAKMAAEKYVIAMKLSVEKEAASLYEQMLAAQTDADIVVSKAALANAKRIADAAEKVSAEKIA